MDSLSDTIVNEDDEYFSTNSKYSKMAKILTYENPFKFRFVLSDGSTYATLSDITEEEFKNYGVILFTPEVYNEINDNSSNYLNFNISTRGVIKLEQSYMSKYDSYGYLYDLDFFKLYKSFYFRFYYKVDNNTYVYSKVYLYGANYYYKNWYEKYTDTPSNTIFMASVCGLNLIAELND